MRLGEGAIQMPGAVDLAEARGSLQELMSVGSLQELIDGYYQLVRVPLRVVDAAGASLARSHTETALGQRLAESSRAREHLGLLYRELKESPLAPGESRDVAAFTGARYRLACLSHDGRAVGRLILGPFIVPGVEVAPKSLCECDPDIDPRALSALLLDPEPSFIQVRVEGPEPLEPVRLRGAGSRGSVCAGGGELELCLARGHVEAHGGRLRVESLPPSRLVAVLELPQGPKPA